jgi:hypothetical protein
MAEKFCRKWRLPRHFWVLLHAVKYDMGQTAFLPLRRKACCGFFRPKNPTASAGFEPANLSTKGQHVTSRPPKPLTAGIRSFNSRRNKVKNQGGRWASFISCCLYTTQIIVLKIFPFFICPYKARQEKYLQCRRYITLTYLLTPWSRVLLE